MNFYTTLNYYCQIVNILIKEIENQSDTHKPTSNSSEVADATYPPAQVAKTTMLDPFIKILIVDDRAAVRESLKTILSLEEDFEVVGEASSGREAVQLAQKLRPDLVLMDLEMPDVLGEPFDGIIACGKIKEQKLCRNVVILTVYADQTTRQRAVEAGCDLFLEKGINSFELLQRLRELVTSKSSSSED